MSRPAVSCHTPRALRVKDHAAGHLEGVQAFHAFMGPFAQILTRSELIAAFGDDTTAILMYDIDTAPVRDAPGAEYVTVTVTAGKITYMRIIFARAPAEAPRRAAAVAEPPMTSNLVERAPAAAPFSSSSTS